METLDEDREEKGRRRKRRTLLQPTVPLNMIHDFFFFLLIGCFVSTQTDRQAGRQLIRADRKCSISVHSAHVTLQHARTQHDL